MASCLLCCFTTNQSECAQMISRLNSSGFTKQESKYVEFNIYTSTKKKDSKSGGVKVPRRKVEHPIISVSHDQKLILAFGKTEKINLKFATEASYLVADRSFMPVFSNSQVFSDMVAAHKFTMKVDVYSWPSTFQVEIYHYEQKEDEILVVIKDLNGNTEFEKQHIKVERKLLQQFESRLTNSFKDFFELFRGTNEFVGHRKFDEKTIDFKNILSDLLESQRSEDIFEGNILKFWVLMISRLILFALENSPFIANDK